jgi:hypothetical protein
MAVGNIVGVEPLPNGGYNFVDKAGTKKTLFGAAADELAQRFKASEALTGPQPTAMNDGAGGTTASDLVVPAGGFGGFGGQVPQPKIATDVPTPVPGAEGPPASIARETQAAPQPGPQAVFAGAKPGETVYKNPDGSIFVETRSAPTKGGPVEKSRTVKGGFGENEEYKEATASAFKEQQSAEELGAATAAHQAAEERGFLEEHQRQLVAQQQAQQAQMETIKRGVAEKQVAYDIAQSKYNNFSEIDQDRIWRKKGTGASILAVIGSALGAFGSALTKTPNFALEIINGAIDRDIRAQEQEIAINREAAGNALADLQRQTGSLDLAKSALGALQTQRVQLQIQAMANKAKTPAAIAAFQKANGMLMQSYADKLEEYRQKAMGEVTKNIVNVAGSAGGVSRRLATVSEAQAYKNLHGESGGAKQQQGVGSERTTKIADNSQAIVQASGLVKKLEGEGDSYFWEPGTPGVRSIPGTEQYEKQKALEQETEALITTNQKASGIGSTEDDRKNVERSVIGGGSVAERRAGAEAVAQQAAARIAAEIATLSPEQQQQQLDALDPVVRAYVGKAMAK